MIKDMTKEEILKELSNDDDFELIQELTLEQLKFYYNLTKDYPGISLFSQKMKLRHSPFNKDLRNEIKFRYLDAYNYKNRMSHTPVNTLPKNDTKTYIPKQESSNGESQTQPIIIKIITDLSKITNTPVNVDNPSEVAEFMMPMEDLNAENKISLFDLLSYLTCDQRSSLESAILFDMPYLAEKTKMNNKFRALARLECQLLNYNNPRILQYIRHDEIQFVNGESIIVPIPDTLLNIRIEDYISNTENELISYVINLFKNNDLKQNKNTIFNYINSYLSPNNLRK